MTMQIAKRTMSLLLIAGAAVMLLGAGSATGAVITIENVPLVGGVQSTSGAAVQAYDDTLGDSTQGSRGGFQVTTPGAAPSYDLQNVRLFLADAINLNETIPHFLAVYDGDPTVIANLVGTSTNGIQPDALGATHNDGVFAEPLDWAFTGLNLDPSKQYSAIFTDSLGTTPSGGFKVRMDSGDHYAGGDSLAQPVPTVSAGIDLEFIVTLNSVPEPTTFVLCGFGLMGLVACGKRRNK